MSGTGGTAFVSAVFAEVGPLRSYLERLDELGVEAGDVEVRSSSPIEDDLPAAHTPTRSRVLPIGLLGALLGGTTAYLVVSLSAQAYPMPTGGMPIVPLPTTGIIVFEGTALGTILFTVAAVLLEGRMFRRVVAGPLDHHLAAGRLLVNVAGGSEETLEEVEKVAGESAVEVFSSVRDSSEVERESSQRPNGESGQPDV